MADTNQTQTMLAPARVGSGHIYSPPSKDTVKIKVTAQGKPRHTFGGKTFTNQGHLTTVDKLGWTKGDSWQAANADPNLVIEEFKKDGKLVLPKDHQTEEDTADMNLAEDEEAQAKAAAKEKADADASARMRAGK